MVLDATDKYGWKLQMEKAAKQKTDDIFRFFWYNQPNYV